MLHLYTPTMLKKNKPPADGAGKAPNAAPQDTIAPDKNIFAKIKRRFSVSKQKEPVAGCVAVHLANTSILSFRAYALYTYKVAVNVD